MLSQVVDLKCLVVGKKQKFKVLINSWLHLQHLLDYFMMDVILFVHCKNVVNNAINSKSGLELEIETTVVETVLFGVPEFLECRSVMIANRF